MDNLNVGMSNGKWVVVIDPIDGTENFTSGLPEWGISISCYKSGEHIGSLLGAPELGRWLRTGDSVQSFQSRIRGLSSSLSREQIANIDIGHEYRIMGCCVVNMLNVISGSYLSFENQKGARSWDILAGLNLALEHGLEVEVDGNSYTGEFLDWNRKFKFKIRRAHATC
jgi:fructose-1,6-bisphosphatase/inositol monophosphatase family enzyme